MSKRAKRIKIVGVFSYDLFPYLIVHDILGWDDDGNVLTDVGTFKSQALVASYPWKKRNEIRGAILNVKAEHRERVQMLKDELLSSLFELYPAMKQK